MDLLQSLLLPQREHSDGVTPVQDTTSQQDEQTPELTPDTALTHSPASASDDGHLKALKSKDEDIYETMSLADFQKLNADRNDEARRAGIDAAIVSHDSPPPSPTRNAQRRETDSMPTPDAIGSGNGPAKSKPPFKPVALGKPRTSEYINALHQVVNKHKLPLPEFEYAENGVVGAGTFSVRMSFAVPTVDDGAEQASGSAPVVKLEDAGPFRSKKEAKEAISEKAFGVLKEKVEEVETAQKILNESRPLGDPAAPTQVTTAPVTVKRVATPGENSVGLLLEFCTAKSLPQPKYQDYGLQQLQTFACEVEIQLPIDDPDEEAMHDADNAPLPSESSTTQPNANIEGQMLTALTFGSSSTAYTSKKAAKTAAATEAIAHLRLHGHLPPAGSSPPRKKQKAQLAVDDADASTAALMDLSASQSPSVFSSLDPAAQTTAAIPNLAPAGPSAQAQMNRLRVQLGLGNIEYRLHAREGTAYYTGWAEFPDQGRNSKAGFGGMLMGRVGEVREEVFGKKMCKEAVARGVVDVLMGEVGRRSAGGWDV